MSYFNYDYDLDSCLEYNPQEGFSVSIIGKVLAVAEGQNDGRSWHWLFVLKNGVYVYLTGGCDYTGWDCQSYATHSKFEDFGQALTYSVNAIKEDADYCEEEAIDFKNQALSGIKAETWRERKDKEFGLTNESNVSGTD
jgi:hypothetical protein